MCRLSTTWMTVPVTSLVILSCHKTVQRVSAVILSQINYFHSHICMVGSILNHGNRDFAPRKPKFQIFE